MLRFIDRFGVEAVMGRVLGLHEMIDMSIADNVTKAYMSRENYRDRKGDPNWAEWETTHPESAELLAQAHKDLYGE